MAKITLDGIVSGFKSVAKLISNFDSIEDNLNNKVLYRDNPEGEPNQMEGELDMNSNRILNLPTATSATEPVTYGQFTGPQTPSDFDRTVVENHVGSDAVADKFTLALTSYSPGLQNLSVYINGVRQLNSTYTETSPTEITFGTTPVDTDEYTFVVNEVNVDNDFYRDAGGRSLVESFVATAGQTVITLANTYTQYINNVSVYRNGVRQSDFLETSPSSITLTDPASAGDEIVVIINEAFVIQGTSEAANVVYTPQGAGAVGTNVQERLQQSVSVNDFDTVANAVAYCYTNALALYWPEVQTVTGNIPNFHDVSHFGPGGVTRGANTWYVEQSPAQQNRTLHVSSASGSNTNDGLDTTYPIQYEPYALTQMLKINPNNGEEGFITLKNDHVIVDESAIVVEKVDAGWVTINSDGTYGESNHTYSENHPSSGWSLGTPNPVTSSVTSGMYYITGNDGVMPTLAVYIDGGGTMFRAYSSNRSKGVVEATYGGQDFALDSNARVLYCNGGNVKASETVWSDYYGQIYFARGGVGNLTQALLRNRPAGGGNSALVVSRGGAVEAQGLEIHNVNNAIEVKRGGSSLNAHRAIIDQVSEQVAISHRAASLSLGGARITNVDADGLVSSDAGVIEFSYGGSGINFAVMTASAGNTNGTGLKASSGGIISARQTTVSGFSEYNAWATSGGVIDIASSTLTGGGIHNVICVDSGRVDVSNSTLSGGTNSNIRAQDGAYVTCTDADVSGAGSGDELYISGGAIIAAKDVTVSTVALTTGDTNIAAFNDITNKGIIYN